jgi:hypothetical protein
VGFLFWELWGLNVVYREFRILECEFGFTVVVANMRSRRVLQRQEV